MEGRGLELEEGEAPPKDALLLGDGEEEVIGDWVGVSIGLLVTLLEERREVESRGVEVGVGGLEAV